jgi:hypothetical protein
VTNLERANLHPMLAELVEREQAERLAVPPQLTQDALTLVLRNGVVLTVRYAAQEAYSLRWRTGLGPEAVELGIDTAPLHPQLASFPNHLHCADGRIVADPLTRPQATPADNLRALLQALEVDPLLGALCAH